MKSFGILSTLIIILLPLHGQPHVQFMSMPDSGNYFMMNMDSGMENMSHPYSLSLPMNMNGSGTGWLTRSSPVNGYMFHAGKWVFMVHGNRFFRYNNQDFAHAGSRGDKSWDAPNWFMFMGQVKTGERSMFSFKTMLSLEYLTIGGKGYPLLFQTGETNKGVPLVDRQHPHDLFSELSVGYTYSISKRTDIFIYLGYPGEPALGPVAFMHRPSAMPNPNAPLSHHWTDATHISFGVATLGLRYDKLKFEVSSFTGREPDETRYNFDKPGFDSWSGRVSYIPTANWTFQISEAFINSPERINPGQDIWRSTASGIFSKQISGRSGINMTGLWGLNHARDDENAFLLEGAWNLNNWNFYGRYEWVQKSTEELYLNEEIYGRMLFPVNELTLGINLKLIHALKTWVAIGSNITFYKTPFRLETLYGDYPMSAQVYLRIFPELMHMFKKKRMSMI